MIASPVSSAHIHPIALSPGGGMVDAMDLKSIVRKDVGVRVPPWAPTLFIKKKPLCIVGISILHALFALFMKTGYDLVIIYN